jgi:hypothetical protein
VLEGNNGGMETVVGSLRPAQRCSTFAVTQQESVEFTVLSEQKEQSPRKLPWKPHSIGSFCTAVMQFPLSASAGLEQRVKSDRIWGTALSPARPHSSGLDTILCSLIANSACVLLAFRGLQSFM